MANVAFIGLGNMGGPMTLNLLKAGHHVTVFDLVPEAIQAAVNGGAIAADSAVKAVEGAEFVISMLPAGRHVENLYIGEHSLLDVIEQNTLIIDSSTIDAQTARKVGAAAVEKGIAMLDAPVSGGVAAAAAGTLSFMCGGDMNDFERAKTVLDAMAKNIFYAGDHGAGQIAKICNNMLLSVLMVGTSEALQLGVDNGLDPSVLSEIMLASSGRNWTLEVYNPYPGVMKNAPASNDYQPGFMVDLMCKDLGLAMQAAGNTRSKTPMGEVANALYIEYAKQGNGKLDFSSILNTLKSDLA
jgi:3-hydroxyisobutyrate dehydrogenase